MRVTSAHQPNLHNRNQAVRKERPAENKPRSATGSNSAIWRQLSREHDIRHASFDEVKSIASKLYEGNEISLGELASLTFNPEEGPQWRNLSQGADNRSWWLTGSDSAGKRDWIQEWEVRAAQQRRLGNESGAVNAERLTQLLTKLLR